MPKYCTGLNIMHEHVVHDQHVHHQSICVSVTHEKTISLDFLLCLVYYTMCLTLRLSRPCQHGLCLQATGAVPEAVWASICICV